MALAGPAARALSSVVGVASAGIRRAGVRSATTSQGRHGPMMAPLSSSFTTSTSTPAAVAQPEGAGAAVQRRERALRTVRDLVAGRKDAFYVVDLGEVAKKYHQFKALLPRVRPFYAVKCNDDPRIVATLAKLGAGFDCASKGEMSLALRQGVPASDIIFAHPAKQPSHIHYAHAKGVQRMTFDNADELRKIAREHPNAQAVLRILTDDSHSVCRLGLKFGCPLSETRGLFRLAKELGVNLVGVSYHVGSGNGHAQSFGDAVRDARTAFDIGREEGFALSLLDIGGGFPGSEMGAPVESDHFLPAGAAADSAENPYAKHPSFATIAGFVAKALDTYFPAGCGVDIIAEPGRYFVKSSHVLAVSVVGKRLTEDEATARTRFNYYVNDGLYGSFNCILYDHVTCAPSLVLSTHHQPTLEEARLQAAAPAAVADDSIARIGADGQVVASDALGFAHAAQLGLNRLLSNAAVAAAACEHTERMGMRMHAGSSGSSSSSSSSSSGSSSLGAAGDHSHDRTMHSAAAPAHRATGGHAGRSGSFSFLPLAAPAPDALAAPSRLVARRKASSGSGSAASGEARYPTTIWGPTCDSMDKISDTLSLPEIAVGDWLVFENMGAYTVAGSCKFNGFPISSKVYIGVDGSVEEVQAEEDHE
jgi:ornithine decarboxylase